MLRDHLDRSIADTIEMEHNCFHGAFSRGRCLIARSEIFLVEGKFYRINCPYCRVIPAPIRSMIETLARKVGRRIVNRETACKLMRDRSRRGEATKWMCNLRNLQPCFASAGVTYYVLRDLVKIAPRHFCDVCGRRAKRSEAFTSISGSFVSVEFGEAKYKSFVVCSAECSARQWAQYQEYEAWLQAERKQLQSVRKQLQAFKRFLKDVNPEVFRSLPEGYGPAETSPTS